jgi:hypothetical protein
MKVRKTFAGGVILVLAGVALLAGCVSTPDRRISRSPALFESFPPEVQERVRAGEVEIGFTPEMVALALGEPDRRLTRRTAEEDRVIWIYQGRSFSAAPGRFYDAYDMGPYYGGMEPVIYADRRSDVRYTRARLEFVDGRLVSIQETER